MHLKGPVNGFFDLLSVAKGVHALAEERTLVRFLDGAVVLVERNRIRHVSFPLRIGDKPVIPVPGEAGLQLMNYLLAVRRIVAVFRAPEAGEGFEPNCDVLLDAALLSSAFARDAVVRVPAPATP